MAESSEELKTKLQELEKKCQLLEEENRQSARLRHMWQDAIVNLKSARKALLDTQSELQQANAELAGNVDELRRAKKYVEHLAYSDQQVINSVSEGVMVTETDGTIVAVNPAFTAITGYESQEVRSHNASLLKSGKHNAAFYQAMWQALGQEGAWQGEIWNRRKNGELFPEMLSISAIRDWSGNTINYVGIFTDLSRQKGMERDLQSSQEQLNKLWRAVEHSPSSILITDKSGTIEYVNPRFALMTGYEEREALGRHVRMLGAGETPKEIYRELWNSVSHGLEWHGELKNRRKNGELYWELISISPIFDGEGEITHFVAVSEDITERKESEARMWQQANFDPLTGLANRALFRDRLNQAIGLALRHGHVGAIMFIDLDLFKPVNDKLGHEAGDELLVQVASRLTAAVRESDTVARLAGDEFCVILPELDVADAPTVVAEKILAELAKSFTLKAGRVTISCSVGIALFPRDGESYDDLLRLADAAMYESKVSGRGKYSYAGRLAR